MTINSVISVEKVSGNKTLRFWILGICVPKSRPRVTRNGTYFPQRYQDWRSLAETEILISLSPSEKTLLPIQRAEVRIKLQGKHRGDIDNIAGSCLDALVAAGILVDDRLSCLPRLVVENEPKGDRSRLPLDVCFVDEEAITPETIEYVERVRSRDDIKLKWACLPIKHRNACSRSQPYWYPWLESDRPKWTREMPSSVITLDDVPGFQIGEHVLHDVAPMLYGSELGTVAEIRGIRAQESIRRLQSVTKRTTDNWFCQTPIKGYLYPSSPIYDWATEDVWVAPQKLDWDYNKTYDILALAGVPPSLQRCTPPYGEEPLQKLWTYQICWPEMWSKMIDRVDGVATAGRYALTDIYGTKPKEPPLNMSWKDWCYSLLELYPPKIKCQVAATVVEIIKLHQSKTNRPIPEVESDLASGVSWKWLCQIINRGDLKGRKQGMLINKALTACKKLGITPEEALNNVLID